VSHHEGLPVRRSSAPRRELTSLTERLDAFLWVRVAIAGTVMLLAGFTPGTVGLDLKIVAALTAAYLVAGTATELVTRAGSRQAVNVHHCMLLVDVAYLVLVVTPTGGPRSQLIFLFYVHLLAVTLLGSYRSGLRIAFCDSVAFIAIRVFMLERAVTDLLGGGRLIVPPAREIAVSIVAFWVVSLCTGYFSFINERELRRGRDELRVLAQMGVALERAKTPDEVIEVLLDNTAVAFGFPRGAVLLNSGTETRALATGGLQSRHHAGTEGSGPDQIVQQAWLSKGPVLVRALDPLLNPMLAGLLPGARNVVVLPLTADGEPLGALAIERGGPLGARLPVRTVAMLGQFAAHGALAARNVRLRIEIERLASIDGLTGLANRRVFETVLAREVARAHRNFVELSLVIFDVDRFKAVNDTLGHQAGDEVLRRVARALSGVAREADLVARQGGEEFAVILPCCSNGQAIAVAERMRAAVAADPEIGATISGGVATLPADAIEGDQLVAAADEALYDAKRAGRNRISAYAGLPAVARIAGPGSA
jgi:two-component system, cell cycle response regulator